MNTALIGLDYIVDIMHPDGRIARCAEQAALRGVVARFNRALAVAEQLGWLRIAVRVGFEPGYPDLPEHSPISLPRRHSALSTSAGAVAHFILT